MFCHGRECYRRNSYLIIYMFFKNLFYVMPLWYFGFYSLTSGIMFYNNWV